MCSSLEVVKGFVEVFLLDLDLGYFIQGATLKKLVITAGSNHLLKVEDGIIPVV